MSATWRGRVHGEVGRVRSRLQRLRRERLRRDLRAERIGRGAQLSHRDEPRREREDDASPVVAPREEHLTAALQLGGIGLAERERSLADVRRLGLLRRL